MKRIVIDFLCRWKWAYGIGFVFHLTLMTFAWQDEDKVMPVSVLLGSAFLLMFEFFKSGGSRTYLSLPITSKELARSWRFVSLEFPVVLFMAALIISALVSWMIKPTYLLNFERFLILVLFQTVMLGTIFYALTGLPNGPADQRSFAENVQGGFHGLLWGFSIPGCMFLAQGIPKRFSDFEPWQTFLAICLAIITIGGWFRAESLVLKRAQLGSRVRARKAKSSSGSPKSVATLTRGFGGIPFHCIHYARLTGVIGLLMISVNWIWVGLYRESASVTNEIDHQFTAAQINFVVPIMAVLTGIMALGQLRSLRSLPISRGQIAGLLVLWPMAFSAIFGVVVVLIHRVCFGAPVLWGNFGLSLLGASFLILTIPAFLRLGFTLKGFVVIFVMFPLVQIVQMLDDRMKSAVPYLWVATLILVPLAYGLSFRLLNTSYPWRAGAMKMKGLMRG